MNKLNRPHTLRSRFHSNKPTVLTDGTITGSTITGSTKNHADLLDLVSQLQQVNFADEFADARRAKQRVRQTVVRRIESQSTWQRLRLLTGGWGQRMVVATVSLTLFATLNVAGLFGLPQRTQHLLDQPVIAARSLVIPVLTVTLPLNTTNFFQTVTQFGTPPVEMSTTTPIQRAAALSPTPVPVPVPHQ